MTSVRCSHCAGTGQVPLPKVFVDTLALLRSGPLTPRQVHARIGLTYTAANYRLEKLRKLGLVARTRSKRGYEWQYRIARST